MKKEKNILVIYSDFENSFFYKALCLEFLGLLKYSNFSIHNKFREITIVFSNIKDCKNCYDYIKSNS